MKITVNKKEFLSALKIVKEITSEKDIYPLLKNVMLEVIGTDLFLKATDLKMSVTMRVPNIKSSQDGRLLLDCHKLYTVVSSSKSEDVKITAQDFNAQVVASGNFKILGEDPIKYVAIPETSSEKTITIKRTDLIRGIQRSVFASTKEKTRYDLDVVLVQINEKQANFIATDGKRLAVAKSEVTNGSKLDVIIRANVLKSFEKMFNNIQQEFVSIATAVDKHLVFITENFVATFRTDDVKFPPYEKVIPANLGKEIEVNRIEFSDALKRVKEFSISTDASYHVNLSFSKEGLEVSAEGETTGTGAVLVPCKWEFEPLVAKFNPDFFYDVLKVISPENVNIALKDERTAFKITDTDFTYVVLPIKPVEQ